MLYELIKTEKNNYLLVIAWQSLHDKEMVNNGNSDRLYFWGAPKSWMMVTAAMKLKDACSLKEKQ